MNFKTTKSRFALLAALSWLMLLATNAEAQKDWVKQAEDVEEVKSCLDKLADAFNRRDGKAVISFFAEDVYIFNQTRGIGDFKGLSESLESEYAAPSQDPYIIRTNVEEIQVSKRAFSSCIASFIFDFSAGLSNFETVCPNRDCIKQSESDITTTTLFTYLSLFGC